jgi:hypothetical protein
MIRSNRRAGVIRRTAPLALVAIVCFIFFSIMNAVNMHPKSPPAPATLIVTPHPTASSPRPTDTKSTLLTRLRDMPFETTFPNYDEMKARQPQPEAKEAKEDQCPKNTFTLPNVVRGSGSGSGSGFFLSSQKRVQERLLVKDNTTCQILDSLSFWVPSNPGIN